MDQVSHEVGLMAGEIWKYLEKSGEASLTDVKKAVIGSKSSAKKELRFNMGLGWLLRESNLKIDETGVGRSRRITLKLNK